MYQDLLTVVFQGQLVDGLMGSLPEQCRALSRLFEQRSLLLFIHEYTRRVHLSAAFISRLNQLQQQHHLMHAQVPPSSPSSRIDIVSLSQELRLHLNHWNFLCSRVHSDHYLRWALVLQTNMLEEMKQTLDLLGLQLLLLMEQYVYGILSFIGKTESDSLPRDVLEDILAGTDLYNQAVEEHKIQLSSSHLRVLVLQEAHKSKLFSNLPNITRFHASAVSVKCLISVLAVHHAEMVGRKLDLWISKESCHVCKIHSSHKACSDNFIGQVSDCSCGFSKWTWKQLWHTYPTSSPLLFSNQPFSQTLFSQTYNKPCSICTPYHHLPSFALKKQLPVLVKLPSLKYKEESSIKNKTSQCQTCLTQFGLTEHRAEAAQSIMERNQSLENCDLSSLPVATSHHASALLPCHFDHSCVEPLFRAIVTSTDLLGPLAFQRSTTKEPTDRLVPVTVQDTGSSENFSQQNENVTNIQNVERTKQDCTELKINTGADATVSSGILKEENFRKEAEVGTRATTAESSSAHGPHSVQWMDMGRLLLLADVLEQYQSQLLIFCTHALWLKLHVAPAENTSGNINLQDDHWSFQVLHSVTRALEMGLFPKEFRTILEHFRLFMFVQSAHTYWDSVVCRGLGLALKDKCLGNSFAATSSSEEGSIMISQTMAHFLQLQPSLLSSLCCCQSNSSASELFGLLPPSCVLQKQTFGLLLASIQMSTVWIMSKAYQFISTWSPNKFLLITQGDLRILKESLDKIIHQTKSFPMNLDSDRQFSLRSHNQHLLSHQLAALDRAACGLQAFSAVVLNNFSINCKRVSGEIFERTMPSAVHWRPSQMTGFPSSPSEYASLAAQAVIGQVLEAVAPLSEDARVQALSVTMTAFMEAWMEHILRQKIKFSVQGALQLKEDFDSIREMIKSDKYGLSAELHQRLLSLSVFQQVDSALLCLLQQPQAKPYLQRRAWDPFTNCCPVKSSRDSLDPAVGNNITNLGFVEDEELTQTDPSIVTSALPPLDTSTPAEPYLASSIVLGAAQQEWLDLRIHSTTRRWRLPGFQCLSKTKH